MSIIRPYLVILLLAVLLFHTVVPVSASAPPVPYVDWAQPEPDKDGGTGHPEGGQEDYRILPGEFYRVALEGLPETLLPTGPGIRLIVIFRGGKQDGIPCWVADRTLSPLPTIHCVPR